MKDDTNRAASVENRRLAAIMFTDMVGFSRQMGVDEARTMRLLTWHNQVIRQSVTAHKGTVIKTVGDAFLVDFPSVVNAVQCAQQIQAQFQAYNAAQDATERIHVRIGIHLGDIIEQDGDVFGEGVNIASRLQGLAEPDTICISQAVYKEIEKKLPLDMVVSLGRPHLKNIAQREPVYALLAETPKGFRQRLRVHQLKLKQWRSTLQIGAVVLVLMWAGVVTLRSFRSPPPLEQSQEATSTDAAPLPLPDKPSIVVLPFVNMGGDPEQKYFSDGITEDLTSDLSKISSLFVISRNTAATYEGKLVKVQEVSKELGVRYVLEGSVRKADGQVRITAQLIDAIKDTHLWSERYDRPFKDIFALQDEIVQKIVTTLRLQLTLREQGILVRKTTDNLEAYDYFLRGVESFVRANYGTEKEANAQARHLLEKALELDPQYAEAYAALGWTYWLEWFYRWHRTPETLARAGELGQRAIALDSDLPGPHRLLGFVYVWQKRHDQAIVEAERAIALDPNDAEGHLALGNILIFAGRYEKAIELVKQAMRLNPRSPLSYLLNLGFAYRMARRYEEAIVPLKRALTLNPNFVPARFALAICYVELGKEEEGRAEMAELLRINPQYSLESWSQDLPYKDTAALERTLAALRKAGLK
jgi:adenylate cyclase